MKSPNGLDETPLSKVTIDKADDGEGEEDENSGGEEKDAAVMRTEITVAIKDTA